VADPIISWSRYGTAVGNEIGFLNNFANSGLTLSRGNAASSAWTRLNIDSNGNLTTSVCP